MAIFPQYFSEFAGGLQQNGMTAGGLVAIILSLLLELTAPRRARIETEFDVSALPTIREFLGDFASRNGWDAAMLLRLEMASEETLLTLIRKHESSERERRKLRLVARKEDDQAVLEFAARERRTFRTGSRCSASAPPARPQSRKSRFGYCVTSHPPCCISSTTTGIS